METRAFREFIIPLKKAPLLPLSLSLPLPLPVLAQFYFLSIRKKKGILPGPIAACFENLMRPLSYSSSLLLLSIPSDYPPFLSSRSIHVTLIWRESLAEIFDSERTRSVPCKCRHKRNEASHLTPCEPSIKH